MSALLIIISAIFIAFGIFLLVIGLGTLYDNIMCLGINKFTVNMVAYIIVGVILIGLAIYNVVMLL